MCIVYTHTHTHTHPNDLNLELVCFTDSGLYHCALHCQTPTVLACSICLQAHILPRSFCHSLLISLSLDITFSMRPFLTPKTPATPRLLSDETVLVHCLHVSYQHAAYFTAYPLHLQCTCVTEGMVPVFFT